MSSESAQSFIEVVSAKTPASEKALATVIYAGSANTADAGVIRVKFDQESEESAQSSEKSYSYLDSYVGPAIGDRVLMEKISDAWIIIGRVNYNEAPAAGYVSNEQLNAALSGYAKLNGSASFSTLSVGSGGIDVNGDLTISETLRHMGSAMRLYGGGFGYDRLRPSVSQPSDTTAEAIYTSLQSLLSALNTVGLINRN